MLANWELLPPRLEDYPDVLQAGEVAELLRIPKLRVYELARRGELPCLRLGRQVRFPREALRQMLQGKSPA